MKEYKVTIKATITKSFFIEADDESGAELEAMTLFNPHSGEAQERYTQEVQSIERI